jgi:hypothetical protein
MRTTQKKLLDFLKDAERTGRAFSVADAADACGYSEISIKTYISKKLEGRWVTKATTGFFRAKGILSVSPAVFADVMSQKSHDSFDTFGEWKEQVERLIGLGVSHGYAVRPAVEDILNRCARR